MLIAFVGAGCGDGSSSSSAKSDVAVGLEIPRKCLADTGASRATGLADIEFFVDDFENGDVDKSAGAGNGIVEVAEHTPVMMGDPSGAIPPPRYLVWVGQGADESTDPLTVIKEARPETFVMYLEDPDRIQIKGAMKCLDSFGVSAASIPD
jgi:hypothetical protein